MRGDGTVTSLFRDQFLGDARPRTLIHARKIDESKEQALWTGLDRFSFDITTLSRGLIGFFPGSVDDGDPVIWRGGDILIGNSVSCVRDTFERLIHFQSEKREGSDYSKREIRKRQYEDLLLFFGDRAVSTGEMISVLIFYYFIANRC